MSFGYCAEIIKDGNPVIQGIVVPDQTCAAVDQAATELAYHLKKVCGTDIPVVKENSTRHDGKYIYLGDCLKTRAEGIDSAKYSKNSGTIFIGKDNIFITGNDGKGKLWRNGVNSLGTLFATYAFLEKYLGVRWLWPGTSGEVIPVQQNIALKESSEDVLPRLQSSRWRINRHKAGWASEKNSDKFFWDQITWLTRHRFSFDPKLNLGHAFTQYFQRFGKTHPEFFSLLPDGTRRSNPYDWSGGNPKYVSMCVTCPGLAKQIVDEWKEKSPRPEIINLNENDTSGDCVCENCLKADNSKIDDKVRLRKAAEKFAAKDKNWEKELGSVSDRYCKFYLAVQKEAEKTSPGQSVMGLIYANYSEPPSDKIQLNEKITLRFCPPYAFPWTGNKVASYKKVWGGWGKTGAKLMFRPNFTIVQCFPIMYQNVFYDLFTFSCRNGMIISDMDNLTGHYGVQGPVNYVIASLNHDGESSLETLENDYFSAFGKAAPLVKQYFDLMKKVSMREDFISPFAESAEGGYILFDFFLIADKLFTPEVMRKADKILTQAANVKDLSAIARQRVEFLRIGLKHAEMLMDTQKAFRKYQKDGNAAEFRKALVKLYRFRASIESAGAVNVGDCFFWEKRHWPRKLIDEVSKQVVSEKN